MDDGIFSKGEEKLKLKIMFQRKILESDSTVVQTGEEGLEG